MNCPDDIKTLLSKWVDGEITPDERARAEEHTAGCAPCRELLDLFRKNETLLANALETEAFGNAVIESVVRTIRQEGPPEADPVEESLWDRLRARPWIPLSAAAAFLLGLGVVVLVQSSQLRGLRAGFEEMRSSQLQSHAAMAGMQGEYERILRDLKRNEAFNGAKSNDIFGIFDDRGLLVRGTFDAKDFAQYEVWRRSEKETEFRKLNVGQLLRPEFLDQTGQPGQVYWYKFRALRANGEAVESAPIQMRIPLSADLSPQESVKVHCFDLAVSQDLGIFLLERLVDGRPVVEKFVVRPGEPVGGPVDVAGIGRVNFTTGLTLGRIEEAHETLSLTYAEPVLDEKGRPIIETLRGGVAVPVTRQHEVPLSIRPNLRATFRADGGGAASLFKGSWLRVKAK